MEKYILVTRIGGYIGRHAVPALPELGQCVSVIDRCTEGTDPRAEIAAVDVFGGDKNIYQKLGCPEIVVHMAWRSGFEHNSPAHTDNLTKYMHFIENLYQGGLKQLIMAGTVHEVGYQEGAIDKDSPCNPQPLYGISKNASRQFTFLVVKQNHAISRWVRTHYIVGNDLKEDSIFSKIARVALEDRTRFPFTTDKNRYDFISTSGLARQIALITS